MDATKLLQWLQQAPAELETEYLAASLLRSMLQFTEQSGGFIAARHEEGFQLLCCEPTFTAWHDLRIGETMMGELAALDGPRSLQTAANQEPIAAAARSLCEFLRMQSSGTFRLVPQVLVPLRSGDDFAAIALLASDNAIALSDDAVAMLRGIASYAAKSLLNAHRFEQFGATFHSFLEVMADAIDAKDPHGQGHSRSVSYYGASTARQMGLLAREVQDVEIAGLLHDIGRLGIPDDILLKSGRLTDEEIVSIRSYPVRGADLVAKVNGLASVAPLIRHHAERFDGKGYPDGLSGTAIPPGARILAVAHSFVAMISHRSYRAPMTVVGGALKALDGMSGQALDGDVVKAFLASLGRGS